MSCSRHFCSNFRCFVADVQTLLFLQQKWQTHIGQHELGCGQRDLGLEGERRRDRLGPPRIVWNFSLEFLDVCAGLCSYQVRTVLDTFSLSCGMCITSVATWLELAMFRETSCRRSMGTCSYVGLDPAPLSTSSAWPLGNGSYNPLSNLLSFVARLSLGPSPK